MNSTDTLKALIFAKYKSIRQFALDAEIPYTTVKSGLEKGIGGMAVETVIKMCKALCTTVDELTKENLTPPPIGVILAAHRTDGYDTDLPEEAQEELEHLRDYIRAKYKKKG